MTKLFYLVIFCIVLVGCNTKSTSLFNGKNLEGWHIDVPEMDTIPSTINPFIVRDGHLVSLGTPRGHLITNKEYKNYRLNIEYRFTGTPGNCGILVHASTPRALYKIFPKSIEVQMEHENAGDFWCIQMNIATENMLERRGPKEDWGIVEGKLRRIKNLTEESENPVGLLKDESQIQDIIGDDYKIAIKFLKYVLDIIQKNQKTMIKTKSEPYFNN